MASEGRERECDRSERWTSSRLLPDGQGSDSCFVAGPLSKKSRGSVYVWLHVCARWLDV